jgi:hypothetical protein
MQKESRLRDMKVIGAWGMLSVSHVAVFPEKSAQLLSPEAFTLMSTDEAGNLAANVLWGLSSFLTGLYTLFKLHQMIRAADESGGGGNVDAKPTTRPTAVKAKRKSKRRTNARGARRVARRAASVDADIKP